MVRMIELVRRPLPGASVVGAILGVFVAVGTGACGRARPGAQTTVSPETRTSLRGDAARRDPRCLEHPGPRRASTGPGAVRVIERCDARAVPAREPADDGPPADHPSPDDARPGGAPPP
jgi:hypothetical protein